MTKAVLAAALLGVLGYRANRLDAQDNLPPLLAAAADVHYGPDVRHLLDLYFPSGDGPFPLVVWFPGGGFVEASKDVVYPAWVKELMDRGMAFASIQYRLAPEHPLPAAFDDAQRAIQFLRLNAEQYGLDPSRLAAIGSSAGGGLSLWLALHDDLAAPQSNDPLARESTRMSCAVGMDAQASYDPRFWIANGLGLALREDPFSLMWGLEPDVVAETFDDAFLIAVAEEVSPINHVSADDPPLLLIYTAPDEPVTNDSPGWLLAHHPINGRRLQDEMDLATVRVEVFQQDPALGRLDATVSAQSIEFLAACLTR